MKQEHMTRIDVVTIFPEMFAPVLASGMLRLAQEKKLLSIRVHDLRDWTHNKHRQVDDVPYGGGPGMVMKPEPIYEALTALLGHSPTLLEGGERTILLTPQGSRLNQGGVANLRTAAHLILICGRYEGVDERVRSFVSDEISLGDYILSGGEIAAMAVIDAVGRLIPGVLGGEESLAEESFTERNLEYPQYTRPAKFLAEEVPKVVLSGHHGEIEKWRRAQADLRTAARRPDLI